MPFSEWKLQGVGYVPPQIIKRFCCCHGCGEERDVIILLGNVEIFFEVNRDHLPTDPTMFCNYPIIYHRLLFPGQLLL